MLVFALPLSAALAAFLWRWLSDWRLVLLPLLVIGAWLLLRYQVPPEGRAEVRLTSTSTGRAQLFGWLTIVTSQCAMVGLAWLGFNKSLACGTGLVLAVTAFPPFIYLLVKADKQRRLAEEEAAKSAPIEWQRRVE
jgi:hypothetical protein